MADNVTIPASGTGDATPKVATDQLATGEHVQIVKLADGTADSAARIAGDAANGLDVDVTRVQGVVHVDDNAGSLTVDGTVTVANPTTNPETGLAKDATLTGGSAKSKLVDSGGTNVAAVSAAGRLSVDASGVAVPVTDNAGSLTVDSGQLPAALVSGRLSVDASAVAVPITDNSGSLTVDAPVGTPVNTAVVVGGAAVDPRSVRALTSADVVTVTPPTLTKGTQGATGFSVQDLKDSGRVNIMWTVSKFVTTATSEALLTVTESRDGAATTTFTSKVVTSGKRLRITSITVAVEAAGSAPAVSRNFVRLRFNTAGAVTTASPLQVILPVSSSATAKTITTQFDDFPDGIEFLGDGTKQIGVTLESPDWVTAANTPTVTVSVFGYEY